MGIYPIMGPWTPIMGTCLVARSVPVCPYTLIWHYHRGAGVLLLHLRAPQRQSVLAGGGPHRGWVH
jgi:hypothetical protein